MAFFLSMDSMSRGATEIIIGNVEKQTLRRSNVTHARWRQKVWSTFRKTSASMNCSKGRLGARRPWAKKSAKSCPYCKASQVKPHGHPTLTKESKKCLQIGPSWTRRGSWEIGHWLRRLGGLLSYQQATLWWWVLLQRLCSLSAPTR